jgi:hypothetical protein
MVDLLTKLIRLQIKFFSVFVCGFMGGLFWRLSEAVISLEEQNSKEPKKTAYAHSIHD